MKYIFKNIEAIEAITSSSLSGDPVSYLVHFSMADFHNFFLELLLSFFFEVKLTAMLLRHSVAVTEYIATFTFDSQQPQLLIASETTLLIGLFVFLFLSWFFLFLFDFNLGFHLLHNLCHNFLSLGFSWFAFYLFFSRLKGMSTYSKSSRVLRRPHCHKNFCKRYTWVFLKWGWCFSQCSYGINKKLSNLGYNYIYIDGLVACYIYINSEVSYWGRNTKIK